jgi:hypothetical protein
MEIKDSGESENFSMLAWKFCDPIFVQRCDVIDFLQSKSLLMAADAIIPRCLQGMDNIRKVVLPVSKQNYIQGIKIVFERKSWKPCQLKHFRGNNKSKFFWN